MGFNKSLLIKMADWSGINGRFRHFLLLSIVLIRIRARIFHTLLDLEWILFPPLAMMEF